MQNQDNNSLLKQCAAEFIGTFALTFIAAGTVVIASIFPHQDSYFTKLVSPGFMVLAMIYTIGEVSGAHINPAVTIGFSLRKDFAWKKIPGYITAQLLGSATAALLLFLLFGRTANVGATIPTSSFTAAFIFETITTFFLMFVIIGTATNAKITGKNSGIAVGLTVVLDGLLAAPISGGSMNPARSFGPAIFGGTFSTYWIYFFAPVAGTLIAVAVSNLLQGKPNRHEQKAAK